MIVDLERSIESCRRNYDNRAIKGEIRLSDEFKKEFSKVHTGVSQIEYGNYSVLGFWGHFLLM